MDIRRAVNNSPIIALVSIGVVLTICVWFSWGEMSGGANKPVTAGFYTVDDGKTWFVDDLNRVPPFEKDGKPAVRVYLFECEGSDTPVVGYLERYTEKGKAAFEKYRAEQKAKPGVMPSSLGEFASLGAAALEVKKPGDGAWINMTQGSATALTQFQCPGGSTIRMTP